MQIPSWPQASERQAELLRIVLESPQWGGYHPFVGELERRFAAYQQCDHGIGLCNGTVSLELALTVLGIGPGDEVIVPAISFISTATAVSRVGAIPVFVDIEPWSFNIDPAAVQAAFTLKTKGVIAVHFGGSLCKIDRIAALCQEHNVWLIEDAAHAHGSEWKGQRAGSFGITGSFSFQNGKVMCSGEGGMLTTSNNDFAEQARSLSNQGRLAGRSFYEHHRLGTNFRLTGFQAAVLLDQLEQLPQQIAHRTRMAALLKRLTEDTENIVWQEQAPEQTQNSFYLLPGRVRNSTVSRDEVHQCLSSKGIPSTPFYPHPLYANPLYKKSECRVTPCPNAEACVRDAFWLPHRVLLADEETLREIATAIHMTFGAERSKDARG